VSKLGFPHFFIIVPTYIVMQVGNTKKKIQTKMVFVTNNGLEAALKGAHARCADGQYQRSCEIAALPLTLYIFTHVYHHTLFHIPSLSRTNFHSSNIDAMGFYSSLIHSSTYPSHFFLYPCHCLYLFPYLLRRLLYLYLFPFLLIAALHLQPL